MTGMLWSAGARSLADGDTAGQTHLEVAEDGKVLVPILDDLVCAAMDDAAASREDHGQGQPGTPPEGRSMPIASELLTDDFRPRAPALPFNRPRYAVLVLAAPQRQRVKPHPFILSSCAQAAAVGIGTGCCPSMRPRRLEARAHVPERLVQGALVADANREIAQPVQSANDFPHGPSLLRTAYTRPLIRLV
jgi:hypothetical protein